MLNASGIINHACQVARVPRYTAQALAELNAILAHICRTVDFSAARGQFNFFFTTGLISTGAGNIITSSLQPLPIDYLRVQTSGGSTGAQRSSKWYFNGVPYDMIEIDLTEFDDQVQQAGIQSYPYFWAKDMSRCQIVATPAGDLVASQTVLNVSSMTGILVGMSVAGGIGPQSVIVPGTTISAITQAFTVACDSHTNTTLDGFGSTTGILPNMTITGSGIPTGATVVSIDSPTQITISAATTTTLTAFDVSFLGTLTLSAAPTAALNQATLIIGNPPVGYPYPPPSGSYPVMIRYQRLMPDLTQAQVDAGAYCWFDDDIVLRDGLTGQMMNYSADNRAAEYIGAGIGVGGGRFGKRMDEYLRLADDNANRAQTVQLDRRVFGRSFSALKNTKVIGWAITLFLCTPEMIRMVEWLAH
jgi:hypothetical protein